MQKIVASNAGSKIKSDGVQLPPRLKKAYPKLNWESADKIVGKFVESCHTYCGLPYADIVKNDPETLIMQHLKDLGAFAVDLTVEADAQSFAEYVVTILADTLGQEFVGNHHDHLHKFLGALDMYLEEVNLAVHKFDASSLSLISPAKQPQGNSPRASTRLMPKNLLDELSNATDEFVIDVEKLKARISRYDQEADGASLKALDETTDSALTRRSQNLHFIQGVINALARLLGIDPANITVPV